MKQGPFAVWVARNQRFSLRKPSTRRVGRTCQQSLSEASMLPVLSILILQGRLANINTGVATSGSCWLHARAAETLDLPWEWAYLDLCIGTACCSAP